MNNTGLLILGFFIFIPLSYVAGQLSGNNLLLYQLGNYPNVEPKDLSTLYNQSKLDYRHNNLVASLELQQFYTKFEERNYQEISQYNIRYNQKGIELQIGNIFETLGRGLLFRAYDIPGSIYEDRIYRVKYAFNRNLEGVYAGYSNDLFTVKALRGYSLFNVLPPTRSRDERRVDLVEAVESNIKLFDQTFGAIFMRNNNNEVSTDYASVYLGGDVRYNITYHLEFAQQLDDNDIFNYKSGSNYAFYASLGYSYNSLGISLEYKDYQNFRIGAGISDPPALIKEHSYRVLNRSTHVPIFIDEKGMQSEVFYRLDGGQLITANFTFVENKFSSRRYLYHEFFAELSTPIANSLHTKFFIDVAQDEFKFERERLSAGTSNDFTIVNRLRGLIEIEAQRFLYTANETQNVQNYVAVFGLNHGSNLSASFDMEYSTDPRIVFENNNDRIWLGGNLTYKPNFRHSISLFVGSRRGGPACTSGICYEVPDFKGFEIRFKSRL